MKFSPKLFHKGLILVLVPVFVEIAFIFALSGLLKEAEQDILSEAHSREVVTKSSSLLNTFFRAGVASHFYYMTGDDRVRPQFEKALENTQHELEAYSELVRGHSDEMRRFQPVRMAAIESLNVLGKTKELVGSGQKGYFQRRSSENALVHLMVATNEFVEGEQQKQREISKSRMESRQFVINFLYFGVAINVLMGIVLVVYFTRGTVNRVRAMVENTRRLSRGETLLPARAGHDEIAQLDSVFHDMADSLNAAAKHRQELMQMVSHDLRTPLTSVKFALSALSEGVFGDLPEKAKKQVAMSEYNSTRLLHLINDLLDIEMLDAGKLNLKCAPVNLAAVAAGSVQSVQAYADSRQISIDLRGEAVEIDADAERLTQVLVNLLSNAIKFSPKKSAVSIDVSSTDDAARVEVADKGRGVPPDLAEKIFERFQQVSEEDASNEHGSGLGLAICKAIIEAHGGKIGVTSKGKDGSIFWFTLPRKVRPPV